MDGSLTHWLAQSLIYSLVLSLNHPIASSLANSLTHSLTRSLTHSPTADTHTIYKNHLTTPTVPSSTSAPLNRNGINTQTSRQEILRLYRSHTPGGRSHYGGSWRGGAYGVLFILSKTDIVCISRQQTGFLLGGYPHRLVQHPSEQILPVINTHTRARVRTHTHTRTLT